MSLARAGAALRVPYGAVLSARQVAVLAVAFPALVHLAVTVRLVLMEARSWGALAVALAMLLVRYAGARACFARRRLWGLAWLAVGILISSELELLAWLRGLGLSGDAMATMAVAMFFAGPCIQAAYGSAFAWIEMRFVAEASDESADQALVAAAVWLVAPFQVRSLVFSRASVLAHDTLSLHLMATVPLALALVALARLVLRRRWIARVSAGHDAQWQLVPWDGPIPPELPAVVRMEQPALPMVLATRQTAEVPYRSTESLELRATLAPRTNAPS
jgi:hypothetical protein